MPHDTPHSPPEFHRALFLSDLHLGAHGCQEEEILTFLTQNDAKVTYLLGDIFDIWDPLFIRWTDRHDRIVALLRERAARPGGVVYLSGNHDRQVCGVSPENLPGRIRLPLMAGRQAVHQTANGLTYLLLHGDVCDLRLFRFHVCTRIGSRIDSLLRLLDQALAVLRIRFGTEARGPVELALRAFNALLYRHPRHEARLVALAEAAGVDGVICGHFHIAALHDRLGKHYVNCGDWTDSCTAVAEAWDGSLRQVFGGAGPARIGASVELMPVPGVAPVAMVQP